MEKIVKLLLAVLIMFSCQNVKELTPQEKGVISNEVKKASVTYWELNQDFSKVNLDLMKTYYDKNTEMLWQTDPVCAVFNISMIRGYDEGMESLDKIFENRASLDFTITSQKFSVLSTDYVIEVLGMDYNIIARGGETYGPFESIFTHVWIRLDGKWKYFYRHQSYRKKLLE